MITSPNNSFQMLSLTMFNIFLNQINMCIHKIFYICNNRLFIVIFGVEIARAVLQHHRKIYSRVTKKQVTSKDKMTSSNNNIYECKCLINFSYKVSSEMRGFP